MSADDNSTMARLLILSSSGLTDRLVSHAGLIRFLCAGVGREIEIWSTASNFEADHSVRSGARTRNLPFPSVLAFREVPTNYVRRLNEITWDFVLDNPSRLSMMRHVRNKSWPWYVRALKPVARFIAAAQFHALFESCLKGHMAGLERSPEASSRLQDLRPDVVVATGPHRYEEPAVVASARRLGIPVVAFITSFDNISIKGRLINDYDGYLVWSSWMKEELLHFYPRAREVPVHIVGAPQFDVFRDERYSLPRGEFCRRWCLDPDHPFIVAAMGVANNIDETHWALDLAQRLVAGELGDAQLLIRPHPFLHGRAIKDRFTRFGSRVVVQFDDAVATVDRRQRSLDREGVIDWVNTFRCAAVVVHLSSSVAIDAALCQTPSVCLNYDPTPGQPNQELVREVNTRWLHYKPVVDSGGTWLADTPEDVVKAIRAYIENPSLHAQERARMAELVCGYTDGQCARRMAEAILSFLPSNVPKSKASVLADARS